MCIRDRLSSGVHVTYLTVKYSLEQLNALVTQVEHDTSTLKAQGVNMAYLGPDAATSTVDAVSYTHLDVYKRQAVGGTFGVGVQPLIEHYSTGAWALVASPLVSGSPDGGLLSGVACTSAERCWAVGAIEPVPNGAGEPLGTATAHPYAGGGEPLIERYSAGSWEVVSGPTAVSGEELSAIDCVSSTDECYACLLYTSRCV